jgi:hypothetical protein
MEVADMTTLLRRHTVAQTERFHRELGSSSGDGVGLWEIVEEICEKQPSTVGTTEVTSNLVAVLRAAVLRMMKTLQEVQPSCDSRLNQAESKVQEAESRLRMMEFNAAIAPRMNGLTTSSNEPGPSTVKLQRELEDLRHQFLSTDHALIPSLTDRL